MISNKIKTKNKIMLSNETRERLKMEGELIVKNHEWWEGQISQKAERLNILLRRDNYDDFDEIEKLEKDIEVFQKRGEIEQKILNEYTNRANRILLLNFCSGIASFTHK